jgi:hypothetical protein
MSPMLEMVFQNSAMYGDTLQNMPDEWRCEWQRTRLMDEEEEKRCDGPNASEQSAKRKGACVHIVWLTPVDTVASTDPIVIAL